MPIPSEQEMRAAIASRDKASDGHFFYGVITTGVFCKPSCAARSALPENLRFFPSVESAIVAGFRPCKRCQPTDSIPRVARLVNIARYIESLDINSFANDRKNICIMSGSGFNAVRFKSGDRCLTSCLHVFKPLQHPAPQCSS